MIPSDDRSSTRSGASLNPMPKKTGYSGLRPEFRFTIYSMTVFSLCLVVDLPVFGGTRTCS